MLKRNLPPIGILLSIGLFIVATTYYPGGSITSRNVVGYDWTQHFISTLFAVTALNGARNPARYFALPAMLMFCISMAAMFRSVSRQATSPAMKKTIDIGGIGAMVYAFLAVATPMHDLLVTVSLVFSLAAILATLYTVYRARQTNLLIAGAICLALVVVSAVMYYGHVLFALLPIAQKLVFVTGTGWVLALYLTTADRAEAVLRRRPNEAR